MRLYSVVQTLAGNENLKVKIYKQSLKNKAFGKTMAGYCYYYKIFMKTFKERLLKKMIIKCSTNKRGAWKAMASTTELTHIVEILTFKDSIYTINETYLCFTL